mmetsp:Transcript_11043/g.34163  ORF Transcript_11043/g.34163 Transcript_11043/m.34163 type:complete len:212 (-) Transcript_11043:653-1288(-)
MRLKGIAGVAVGRCVLSTLLRCDSWLGRLRRFRRCLLRRWCRLLLRGFVCRFLGRLHRCLGGLRCLLSGLRRRLRRWCWCRGSRDGIFAVLGLGQAAPLAQVRLERVRDEEVARPFGGPWSFGVGRSRSRGRRRRRRFLGFSFLCFRLHRFWGLRLCRCRRLHGSCCRRGCWLRGRGFLFRCLWSGGSRLCRRRSCRCRLVLRGRSCFQRV